MKIHTASSQDLAGLKLDHPVHYLRLTVILGFSAILLIGFLSAVSFYSYYKFTNRIVPGVSVGNTGLGGLTTTEAAIELHKKWNLENPIQVSNGLTTLIVPAEQLGLSIDALKTAMRAYEVAHNGFILAEVMQMVVSINEGWEITPATVFDENIARTGIETLASQFSQAPRNATLYLDGEQIIPIPGDFGFTVNNESTLETIKDDPQAILESGNLEVTLMPVLPQVMDATDAAAEAQALIDETLTIHAYDPIFDKSQEWTIDRPTLASWLMVELNEDGPRAIFDRKRVSAYLNSLSAGLGPGLYLDGDRYGLQLAEALREGDIPTIIISHEPTTYVVQPGDTLLKIGWKLGMPFWMILAANPDIDPDSLWVGAELVIPSKSDLIPLPIVPGKRIVMSIRKQHMWVYQDGSLIRDFVISTGIDRSPTQPGIFQVQSHQRNAYASVWDLTMPHFLGVYEAWPGFMNGIHGLPTLSNGRRLWANILGRPASYGCIILDLKAAEWLYHWAEEGVIVEITN